MIRASVFRCFLDVLAKDAGLLRSDMGAVVVWDQHLSDAREVKADEQA
jgi:beta-lactamase class D